MSENTGESPQRISRRDLLKKGAKVAAGTALTTAGLAGISKVNYDAQTKPDPLTASYKSEVEAISVPERKALVKQLGDKYKINLPETEITTFRIEATSNKGGTDSSFAILPLSVQEPGHWNRMFILVDNNAAELIPLQIPKDKTTKNIRWYIPGRDAIPGKDIGKGDSAIPGSIGMQEILSYSITDNGEPNIIYYFPPLKQRPELTGWNREMQGVPVQYNKLPDQARTLLRERLPSAHKTQ